MLPLYKRTNRWIFMQIPVLFSVACPCFGNVHISYAASGSVIGLVRKLLFPQGEHQDICLTHVSLWAEEEIVDKRQRAPMCNKNEHYGQGLSILWTWYSRAVTRMVVILVGSMADPSCFLSFYKMREKQGKPTSNGATTCHPKNKHRLDRYLLWQYDSWSFFWGSPRHIYRRMAFLKPTPL